MNDQPNGRPIDRDDTAPLNPANDLLAGVSRRHALGGGLFAGALLLWVAGCQNQQLMDTGTVHLPDPKPEPRDPNPTPAPVVQSTAPVPQYAPPVGSPNVVSRSRWTRSTTIAALANPMNGINRMTIHHTAVVSTNVRTEADSVAMLNSVRNGHLKRGWADIGYHYVVDPSGRVWEGRPITWQGAHVEDNNEHNLGVCVLGNFDKQAPTPQAIASLDNFIVDAARRYRIASNRIYTHRELRPTECPGTSLQRYMVATRSNGGRVRSALA